MASVALRYPHPQQGLGIIPSRDQLLPQRFQPTLLAACVYPRERLAIDPRRSGICAAAVVGLQQNILATDLVPQSIEAESRFSLSFRL